MGSSAAIAPIVAAGPTSTAPPASDGSSSSSDETATSNATSNSSGNAPEGTKGFVDIIDVDGYIDPVMRDFILNSVEDAVGHHAEALVIQLNSPGSLLSAKQQRALTTALRAEKRVAITVWVGGDRARANGGAGELVSAASVVGMATRTSVEVSGTRYSAKEALKAKVAQVDAPVLVQFVGLLDGRTVNGRRLDTATDATAVNGKIEPKPYGVRFAKLGLVPRLAHTSTNPSVAYFLFVVALSLFIFEFFTGGIGVAAGVGLLAFVMALSGLGNLPTRPLGVVLLLVGMLGFAIDVQAGTPRFWTAVGTVSLVLGSLFLYRPGTHVAVYWIAAVVVMVVLFMVNGMPTMVRTRFATPTIGREGMIGELGEARGAIDPDGIVVVKGGPWRARTNRATPIATGDAVRVVAIDGLLLEVEPLEGAAKDAGH